MRKMNTIKTAIYMNGLKLVKFRQVTAIAPTNNNTILKKLVNKIQTESNPNQIKH